MAEVLSDHPWIAPAATFLAIFLLTLFAYRPGRRRLPRDPGHEIVGATVVDSRVGKSMEEQVRRLADAMERLADAAEAMQRRAERDASEAEIERRAKVRAQEMMRKQQG